MARDALRDLLRSDCTTLYQSWQSRQPAVEE
jgi:hypothetical protein